MIFREIFQIFSVPQDIDDFLIILILMMGDFCGFADIFDKMLKVGSGHQEPSVILINRVAAIKDVFLVFVANSGRKTCK